MIFQKQCKSQNQALAQFNILPINYVIQSQVHIIDMLLFLLVLSAIYWIGMSIFCYRSLKKIFKRYKDFPLLSGLPESYQAFTRKDFGKWDEKTILRRSYTQFPIRFFAMASFIIIYAFLVTLHKYLKFPTSSMINFYRKWYGGTCFKFCFKVVEEFNQSKDIDTPIIVANHSTWMDIFYFGCTMNSFIAFVSKKQVTEMPFIVNCAQFLQCILVDRSSAEARSQVKKDIETRVKQYQSDKVNNYPVIIFPEGTVSDGRSLMEFKNGAFQTLAPITLFCLKYQCKQFHVSDNDMTPADNMIMTLCVNSTLRVFKEKISPKQNETVEEYRQRSRKRISQMGGFKIYDCSYKEYFEYRKMMNDKVKELGGNYYI